MTYSINLPSARQLFTELFVSVEKREQMFLNMTATKCVQEQYRRVFNCIEIQCIISMPHYDCTVSARRRGKPGARELHGAP